MKFGNISRVAKLSAANVGALNVRMSNASVLAVRVGATVMALTVACILVLSMTCTNACAASADTNASEVSDATASTTTSATSAAATASATATTTSSATSTATTLSNAGIFTISGMKYLDGRIINAGEFSFRINALGAYTVPANSTIPLQLGTESTLTTQEKYDLVATARYSYYPTAYQPVPTSTTVSNAADGSVTFSPLVFQGNALGSTDAQRTRGMIYAYTVSECLPTDSSGKLLPGVTRDDHGNYVYNGVTYDDEVKRIYIYVYERVVGANREVVVVPLGDATFNKKPTSNYGTVGKGYGFENLYKGTCIDSYAGRLYLEGKFAKEDTFSFNVYEISGSGALLDTWQTSCDVVPNGLSSSSSASVSLLQRVPFTQAGVYYFAVRQVSPGEVGVQEGSADEGSAGEGSADEGSADEGSSTPSSSILSVAQHLLVREKTSDVVEENGERVILDKTDYVIEVLVTGSANTPYEATVVRVYRKAWGTPYWETVSLARLGSPVVWVNTLTSNNGNSVGDTESSGSGNTVDSGSSAPSSSASSTSSSSTSSTSSPSASTSTASSLPHNTQSSVLHKRSHVRANATKVVRGELAQRLETPHDAAHEALDRKDEAAMEASSAAPTDNTLFTIAICTGSNRADSCCCALYTPTFIVSSSNHGHPFLILELIAAAAAAGGFVWYVKKRDSSSH